MKSCARLLEWKNGREPGTFFDCRSASGPLGDTVILPVSSGIPAPWGVYRTISPISIAQQFNPAGDPEAQGGHPSAHCGSTMDAESGSVVW